MKRQKNKNIQGSVGPDDNPEAARTAARSASPDPVAQPAAGAFDQLIPTQFRDRVQPIPAELVHLLLADMPVRSARQRIMALPFALEDQVAQSLEATHCAICGSGAEGQVLAATVARDVMDAAIANAPDTMLIPEQMLLPPPAPGQDGALSWHCYRSGPRVLVRGSDRTGFAVQADMLAAFWERAGKPAVISIAHPLPAAIPHESRDDVAVVAEDDLRVADLRQGAYQPSRGLARPLKWLAASVALAALGHLGILAMDTAAQGRIAEGLRAEAAGELAVRLPDASAEDPPQLVMRRLAALHAPQTGSGFLPLMDRVSRALQAQETTVQFREIAWAEETLRLTVEAADLDGLQQAEASLADSGLQVTSGSATASDGTARAELTVQP